MALMNPSHHQNSILDHLIVAAVAVAAAVAAAVAVVVAGVVESMSVLLGHSCLFLLGR